MILLQGYDMHVLKGIFEDVEYDIELLHEEENGDFFGLNLVLSDDKLYVLFSSDKDGFDCDVSPWEIFLDEKFEYKQGYLEEYIVREIIEIFKTYDLDNLKVVIDDNLEELKIYNNDEVILEYHIQ